MKNNYNVDLSLTIPFFNEEKNVSSVIKSLLFALNKEKINFEVIAIDNGSFDSTGTIIDQFKGKDSRVRKLRIDKNQGYGYAIKKGLSMCRGNYIGYLWGDNQISPEVIPRLLYVLKNEPVSLCKIWRKSRTESIGRKIESYLYNFFMKILFGINSKDMNGCPKIMKSEVYKSLNIMSKDWFIDAEIMIKCGRKGYKIKELPVNPTERKAGMSKVNFMTSLEFAKNILKYRLFSR